MNSDGSEENGDNVDNGSEHNCSMLLYILLFLFMTQQVSTYRIDRIQLQDVMNNMHIIEYQTVLIIILSIV